MAHSQSAASVHCGVNSALALACALGSTVDGRANLEANFPAATVSLLDVKQMCAQQNVATQSVKVTLDEPLQSGIPSIIGLSEPEHFTLLLDGNAEEVRLLEGEDGALQVVPRREIEARFTGFALIPQITPSADAPQLQTPRFDQYVTFGGLSSGTQLE